MVNHSDQLDNIFSALSDPTRRTILKRLSNQSISISELAVPLKMSLPGASKHIHILERAGLLRQEKVGRTRKCTLVTAPLSEAEKWIDEVSKFWNERLDSLEDFLKEENTQEKETSS